MVSQIWIGRMCVKQQCDECICTHQACLVEWRATLLIKNVHTTSTIQDSLDTFSTAAQDCVEEGAAASAVNGIDRSTRLEDKFGSFCIGSTKRVHECCAAGLV